MMFTIGRIQLIRKFIAFITVVNQESLSFFLNIKWIYFPIILDEIVFSALSKYLVFSLSLKLLLRVSTFEIWECSSGLNVVCPQQYIRKCCSCSWFMVGRPVRLFVTSSVSRFQAPLGPLGLRCRNTLTTGTWVSFSLTAPPRVTRGPSFPRALAAACMVCFLLIEADYFIGLDKSQSTPSCVFWVSYVTRCV